MNSKNPSETIGITFVILLHVLEQLLRCVAGIILFARGLLFWVRSFGGLGMLFTVATMSQRKAGASLQASHLFASGRFRLA